MPSTWQRVTYNQNGTITVSNPDLNQPVQGNGRYAVPRMFGLVAKRIDLQSSEGSTSRIWDYRWTEPWRGSV